MKPLQSYLTLLPVCMCLSLSPLGVGAVLQEAPTIQEANNALQSQDYAEVEDICRQIVQEDSSNAQGWFLLGYSLHAQGELDEAILAHITATSFPQTAALAFYNLGCAQALKGNPDQAFMALGKAVELGIGNPQQYQGDTDLVSLREDARWGGLIKSMQPQLSSQPAAKKAPKAAGDPLASGLHFWVGEWDVYSAKNGKLAGHNILEFRVNKHVIHESWASNGDSYTGESWNHYDTVAKAWKQTWVGSGGDVTVFTADTGSDAKGVMFVGKAIDPSKDDGYTLHQMHVRPIDGKRVRQTGSESTDDGASWVVKYDLIYVKKGEAFELEDMGI